MRDSDRITRELSEDALVAFAGGMRPGLARLPRHVDVPVPKELIVKALRRLNAADGRFSGAQQASAQASAQATAHATAHASTLNTALDADRVDMLCDALISCDADAAVRLLRDADGGSSSLLGLDYIAAAARRMGERWVEDCASFLDVTLASGRLTGLVRDLYDGFGAPEPTPLPGAEILITTVPGETHALGASIAAEVFRRGGWDVMLLDGAEMPDIAAQVSARDFPVVGLSAGARRAMPALAATVRTIRRIRPGTLICVGGAILTLEPDVIRIVGADHATIDPGAAAVMLHRHVACPPVGTGLRHVEK